ncbi:hypothetical protein AVEN_190044-1, partial [Araneus ventricosus]
DALELCNWLFLRYCAVSEIGSLIQQFATWWRCKLSPPVATLLYVDTNFMTVTAVVLKLSWVKKTEDYILHVKWADEEEVYAFVAVDIFIHFTLSHDSREKREFKLMRSEEQ